MSRAARLARIEADVSPLRERGLHACSYRVELDVTHQCQQVLLAVHHVAR
ncbi:MAG: hypothetical protein H0U97_09535 [Gammaproteobacteria bacterium]|nr:hypothetical protein [Gammaproteobacteria bacterium]